jgi:glycosyltransferase involved in cell wall biosynthesis/GT2 family glycosyltransferase
MPEIRLSVAIPTYGREQVLITSISALLALDPPPEELLVVDQTPQHDPITESQLSAWQQQGKLRWIRLSRPSIIAAMNLALQEARGEQLLFVDDDIDPSPQLLTAHLEAARQWPGALIAGRVLQPWHRGQADTEATTPFAYNTLSPRSCADFIGCNVSMPRQQALALGGFDANFVRVAYRYEAEFSHRWLRAGHPIRYAPDALLHHLQAERGGTRSYGRHLTTLRPDHAVGRYYFQLRTRPLPAALAGCTAGLLRSVRTRHHLSHPCWIPLTLLAEARGFLWALRLHLGGASLLPPAQPRLLIAGSHPIQYHTPLFQRLAADPSLSVEVLYLNLPDAQTQGLGFGVPFTWDVPLLEGYRWRQARSGRGRGITSGYRGVWLRHPLRELGFGALEEKPDALLLTGWHFLGLVQLFLAARILRIPVLLRMDSNQLRPRPWPLAATYWLLFRGVAVGLTVGKANARWYRNNGVPADRLIPSPHYVDNDYFAGQADALRPSRQQLRQRWAIPAGAFCFLFAGKLQSKKRPLDLLAALAQLQGTPLQGTQLPHPIHLLMVGSGHLESECRQFVERHQLPVSFTGFLNQSEIPAAYAACDCLVLPSDHGETWGLVVNEAMACGLPAIVSDLVGCAEDLVEPGQTGMVVPCGDTAALAGSLKAMAGDPQAAARMGVRARERVHSRFTIASAAAGIRRGLDRVLAR